MDNEEWNKSMIEVDEGFELAGDVKSNTLELSRIMVRIMCRNDKYEEAMKHIHSLMEEKQYTKAKEECEALCSGELKHRCENASFWNMLADIEKVVFVIVSNGIENRDIRFGD